ncbi:hypothetical protein [Tellurirhabdus rosea]|uniref:hypothetical protein n=1 Tax=Tellurirhabdus rosea TaxID=2674997 RepID=UPI002255E43C|nr:hypothetical protein [Tellurirhabdus rosea]
MPFLGIGKNKKNRKVFLQNANAVKTSEQIKLAEREFSAGRFQGSRVAFINSQLTEIENSFSDYLDLLKNAEELKFGVSFGEILTGVGATATAVPTGVTQIAGPIVAGVGALITVFGNKKRSAEEQKIQEALVRIQNDLIALQNLGKQYEAEKKTLTTGSGGTSILGGDGTTGQKSGQASLLAIAAIVGGAVVLKKNRKAGNGN